MPAKKMLDIDYIHQYCLDIVNRVIYVMSNSEIQDTNPETMSLLCKNLDILNYYSNKPIKIVSSNSGGDCYCGFSMYNNIKNSKSPVDYYMTGSACSMGTIIPQAARKRYIHSGTDFMIHLGESQHSGSTKMVESEVEYFKKHKNTMFTIYAERCQHGEFFKNKKYKLGEVDSYIRNMIDKKEDWWMTAKEAVVMGFADEVI